MGGPAGDGVEVVELQRDTGLPGDGQQVEHSVCRSPEGHHRRDRVLERRPGQDLARADVGLQETHHRFPRPQGEIVEPGVDRGHRGRPGQRETERLPDGGHRVGGEHPGTRAGTGAGGALDLHQVLDGDPALELGADPLEDVDDRDVPTLVAPGEARSPVEEHRGQIEPGGRHHHPGQRLVTPGDGDQRVEALGVHDQLHRVGDDLPGDERGTHPLVTHRDPVGDGDGREHQPHPASVGHPFLGMTGELGTGEVAWGHLVPRGDHTDLGLGEVLIGQADGAQHGTGTRPGDALGHFLGSDLVGHWGRNPKGSGLAAAPKRPQFPPWQRSTTTPTRIPS